MSGWNVEGTMRYSPGGRQKRLHTSRRLMKVSERAAEQLFKKKCFFRCISPWYWKVAQMLYSHMGAPYTFPLHHSVILSMCISGLQNKSYDEKTGWRVSVYIRAQAAGRRKKYIRGEKRCEYSKYWQKYYHLGTMGLVATLFTISLIFFLKMLL